MCKMGKNDILKFDYLYCIKVQQNITSDDDFICSKILMSDPTPIGPNLISATQLIMAKSQTSKCSWLQTVHICSQPWLSWW